MSKLSKQEVNAIASKLHRELSEKIRLEGLRAIHEYIPSPLYTSIQDKFQRIKEIQQSIEKLLEEQNLVVETISSDLDKSNVNYPRYWYNSPSEYAETILDNIIKKETKTPNIPTIEELKDNIIIAAIDSDFDVDSYIEAQLNDQTI